MKNEKVNDTDFSLSVPLPGFFAGYSKSYHKKSSRIVQHYVHSYDKDGNVIVVRDKDEDRQALINSFELKTGVQNIMALIEKTKDWSLANNAQTITGDVSAFTGSPLEVEQMIIESQRKAQESIDAFNKKFGTNFTREQFISLMDSGELKNVLQEINNNLIQKKGEE